MKQPMDDDVFDLMNSMLERERARSLSPSSRTSSEEEPSTSWRVIEMTECMTIDPMTPTKHIIKER